MRRTECLLLCEQRKPWKPNRAQTQAARSGHDAPPLSPRWHQTSRSKRGTRVAIFAKLRRPGFGVDSGKADAALAVHSSGLNPTDFQGQVAPLLSFSESSSSRLEVGGHEISFASFPRPRHPTFQPALQRNRLTTALICPDPTLRLIDRIRRRSEPNLTGHRDLAHAMDPRP